MAAVAGAQTVNITINDIEVQAPKGEMVIESIKRIGLEVPIFCYHPRMKPVGMCRMCLVEVGTKMPDGTVRKMPKPQTACSLPASEGLVIFTDTAQVHNDRRGVLEFLLINHPLDCPICDRGGECPLQNNTLFYGPSTSRFVEFKRHAPKAFPLSKYVTLDLERCIQCGRCVRFTEEISGDGQLAFRFRGARMQPSTFEMREFESKFSGNVIEICPVGALTSAKYRFRARPWDLQTRPGLCTRCGNGCNVYIDYRQGEIARINGRTNEAVNEEWTCDRGKFGHYVFNTDKRLAQPLKRSGSGLKPVEWSEVFADVISGFAGKGAAVAGLGGSRNSNEDLFLFQKMFRELFGSNNIDHRLTRMLPEQSLTERVGVGEVNSTIASYESQKAVLLFGTSLADEEPILFLRVRKAWFQNGTKVIVAHHRSTDADGFAHLVLRYKEGTEAIVAAGLANAAKVKGADARFTPEYVETQTGVRAADLIEAAQILREANAPIVTTRAIYNEEHGVEAVEALAAFALGTGADFNCYGLNANDQGALELGVTPFAAGGLPAGLNTHQILEGCANGTIKALWLLGLDPLNEHPDRALVERALENVEFLVVQDWSETECLPYASVVLPMTAPSESEGSWTNIERRVQRMRQVLPERGSAKPAWKAIEDVCLRIKSTVPFFNPADVTAEIAKTIPAFAGVSYEKLVGEGYVLGAGSSV